MPLNWYVQKKLLFLLKKKQEKKVVFRELYYFKITFVAQKITLFKD